MNDSLANLSDYLPLSPLATRIGIICLIAQIALTILLNKRTGIVPDGPWTHLAAFTSHQLVALPLMIIMTYCGWRDWFFHYEAGAATAADRIFGYSNPNDTVLAIASGAILLWDIPMGFISPQLRDPIMWGHHFGMFMVSSTMCGTFCKGGNMIGYYYAPFYFGVIEMSSLFLTYVDIFHPKYKHYYNWLQDGKANEKPMAKLCHDANEVARVLFAITFMLLRGIYFPYVSFRNAIPDLWEAYKTPPDGVPMWTGYFLAILISSFALLQAYWGLLISKQVMKLFTDDDDKKSGSGKKKD